jgi:hypothetical protein
MNAQRFQQVRTDVRRALGRHALVLGLSLSLLVVALAGQRYAARHISGVPVAEQRRTAAATAPDWPGATLMGSAYNGQTHHATRLIGRSSAQGWPGATLTGSAYNGQTHSAHITAGRWRRAGRGDTHRLSLQRAVAIDAPQAAREGAARGFASVAFSSASSAPDDSPRSGLTPSLSLINAIPNPLIRSPPANQSSPEDADVSSARHPHSASRSRRSMRRHLECAPATS